MSSSDKLRKLICVGSEPGFTIGKEYEYRFKNFTYSGPWLILIKNDLDIEIEHRLNGSVITLLPPTDIWIEYIGDNRDGLTNGKYYRLLGATKLNDKYYYFLDDNNDYVGAHNGGRFHDVSKLKLRNDKLKELGI